MNKFQRIATLVQEIADELKQMNDAVTKIESKQIGVEVEFETKGNCQLAFEEWCRSKGYMAVYVGNGTYSPAVAHARWETWRAAYYDR